ncbi:Kinesin motor domain family protein [Clavispora lusitaniae]|uniref:Kinesin motor domain family protein n=1 Tax=Clavispora lusitaniae TaxID=36911 RepID=UPI0016A6CBC5|nr:kinesin-like protein Klp5 [Clavispora lusitaniae]KAF7584820.1 Kinesin motor domain family protein [Clavispora lusitaniae]
MIPVSSRQSSISVAVRVRPFTPAEEDKLVRESHVPLFVGDGSLQGTATDEQKASQGPKGLRKIVKVVDDKMLIFDPPDTNPLSKMQKNAFPNGKGRIKDYRFVFDRLFDEHATQNEVYESTTKPLLDSILDGFNATVFAYGATGCGKTHTISGTPENPGVIFLTMKELYERLHTLSDTKIVDVSISFLEIYNETIRDLLNPETSHKKLVLREDSSKRIVVSNLSSRSPSSVEEVMEIIMLGNSNRTCSPTEANAASSRSHAVLQINVVSRDRTASLSEEHTFATLSIIDLAGSERAAATKNRGATLNEGANINKSLLALGNCINALCDPRRKNHVPYRNSKLTRLLKFSLGGNCKTVMIVCISPSSQHYDETLNTLKYADRAKDIKTKLVRNRQNLDRHVGSYLKMITEQKQEIEELRQREATVVQNAIKQHDSSLKKCMTAITKNIQSLKSNLDKQVHEKWRKYFQLAKRKLLLLQSNDLSIMIDHLREITNNKNIYEEFHELIPTIKRILVQSEQLNNKCSEQIINLERQYDTPSEIDEILKSSTQHTLERLKEMDGWSDEFTDIFHQLIEALKDRLQKDFLVNSSILFDYLIGATNDYNYIPRGLSRLVQSLIAKKEDEETTGAAAILHDIRNILERMNDTDYDAAVEEATTHFMHVKAELEEQRSRVDMAAGFSESTPQLSNRQRDKRFSTSPLRSSRAIKKLSKFPSGWNAGSNAESDISMDDSTIGRSDLDEDSPMSNRIIEKSLLDTLDLNHNVQSPPSKAITKADRKSRMPALTETKLSTHGSHDMLAKLPLLNKQASTKIVHNEIINTRDTFNFPAKAVDTPISPTIAHHLPRHEFNNNE